MIQVDKYTNIERGADHSKEYYINHNGNYISLSKDELEKVASDLKLLGIDDAVGRSELLLDFLQWYNNNYPENYIPNSRLGNYLQGK